MRDEHDFNDFPLHPPLFFLHEATRQRGCDAWYWVSNTTRYFSFIAHIGWLWKNSGWKVKTGVERSLFCPTCFEQCPTMGSYMIMIHLLFLKRLAFSVLEIFFDIPLCIIILFNWQLLDQYTLHAKRRIGHRTGLYGVICITNECRPRSRPLNNCGVLVSGKGARY